MRPFVAVVLLPLRRFTQDDDTRTRSEAAGKVDNAAEKLRRAKQRTDSVGTPTGNRSVPDQGVVCSDERDRYLFSSAADTRVLEFSNTTVTDVQSGEWIESDAAIDVEGWA